MKTLRTILLSLIGLGVISLALLNLIPNSPIHYIVVKSGSMSPTIHTGDLAFVYKVPNSQINNGDIILYSQKGNLVIHRVIDNNSLCLITKGDTNINPDLGCSNDVFGKYFLKIPWLGYPLFYIQFGIKNLVTLINYP